MSGEHIAEIVGIALLAVGACYAFAWWVASLAETPERIVGDVVEIPREMRLPGRKAGERPSMAGKPLTSHAIAQHGESASK